MSSVIEQIQLQSMRECEPFCQLIEKVRSQERPSYILTATGLEKISDGLSDQSRSVINRCYEQIGYITGKANEEIAKIERRRRVAVFE